jgi:hypothetical protein
MQASTLQIPTVLLKKSEVMSAHVKEEHSICMTTPYSSILGFNDIYDNMSCSNYRNEKQSRPRKMNIMLVPHSFTNK